MITGRKPVAREDDLTDRERDVLEMIAEGASNAANARALGLSLKTVHDYVSRILDKLHVADHTQATLRAATSEDEPADEARRSIVDPMLCASRYLACPHQPT